MIHQQPVQRVKVLIYIPPKIIHAEVQPIIIFNISYINFKKLGFPTNMAHEIVAN